jgi:SAM-dependent methyltransferase
LILQIPEAGPWQPQVQAVAKRFNQEYLGQPFELPPDIEEMPVFRDWVAGSLTARIATPFWELVPLKKGMRCLDLGCGLSFLVYPWKTWQANFYGQDISTVAQQALTQRGPQLDSKLFKGVLLAPAHQLNYEADFFDVVIATGVSCYYSLDYWRDVLLAAKKCLKPGGIVVFDVVDPELPLAENWAILETYLGAEVTLEPLAKWQALVRELGGKIAKHHAGEVFHGFKVQWG